MKKIISYLKNKFILTTTIFLVYSLFLDENDVFTLFNQNRKLKQLEEATAITQENLAETLATIRKLRYPSEVERFAREKKLFKQENEEIFVISYE